jgi:hypothetical protein
MAQYQGANEEAEALLQACMELDREQGNQPEIANDLTLLATIAYSKKEYGRAVIVAEEALQLAQSLNLHVATAEALLRLGCAVRERGDLRRAQALGLKSLRLYCHSKGMRTARCIEQLAETERCSGDAETAARLLGAAMALRQSTYTPLPPGDREQYALTLDGIQAQLGAVACATALEVGRAASLADLLAYLEMAVVPAQGEESPDSLPASPPVQSAALA